MFRDICKDNIKYASRYDMKIYIWYATALANAIQNSPMLGLTVYKTWAATDFGMGSIGSNSPLI